MALFATKQEPGAEFPDDVQLTLLKAVVSDATVGICVLDSQLRFVFINDALAAMNGLPAEAHVGRRVGEVVPDLAEPARRHFELARRNREPISDLILVGETALHPGVRRAWRETWYLLDVPGNETYAAVLVREITEERRLAEQAVEAARRKATLLAAVAHELCGPMAPLANVGAVLRESRDPHAVRCGEVIERQVAQLEAIAADLNEAASRRREMFSLERRRVRLGDVVDDAVANVGNGLAAKHHDLRVTASNLESTITGDPLRLTQVLTNLLSNAIKYTPDGGTIEIAGDVKGSLVTIAVSDTGLGIPRGELDTVFELLSRGGQEDGKIKGSGIGLWLARELVEAHGGSLTVRSEEGVGATFTISLPAN